MTIPRWLGIPRRSAGARHRIPFNERTGAEQAVVSRPQELSTDSEEMLHDPVNRRDPLELSGRREPPHLALPLTRRVVGDFSSIVRVLIGDVGTTDGITVRHAAAEERSWSVIRRRGRRP